MRNVLFGFLLISTIQLLGQQDYPKDIFRSPLDIPLILSGTFGELRSNHFHGGIDIKTQQREGLPIYAIGKGTIVRIKVALWGYGKVIYVAHPSGHTSVYGHLQKFSPKIEEYIKKIQYQKKSYEVEVFPDFGALAVEKGELIAYSGNSGGSFGPHLHFEIRNSVSEKPTNPLHYGIDVPDATNPIVEKLFLYPLSKNAQVNKSTDRIEINFSKQADGTFLANKVTALGNIGVGFIGFDRQDMAANRNGAYATTLAVNGKTYTDYSFDSFAFSETQYINTLIDYEYLAQYGKRIQKCFKTAGNALSIYNTIYNKGEIEVNEGLSYTAVLTVKDIKGNEAIIKIPIEGKSETILTPNEAKITERYVIAKKPNNYDLGGAKVYFPANTFYEDFYIDIKKEEDIFTIHKNTVPAHRNFTVTFDASSYSAEEQKQLFIARLDHRMRPSFINTYKRSGTFTAKTKYLGTYTLVKDNTPPTVRTKNFKDNQWLSNYKYLSLTIADDLSGVNTYNATINGEWVLMEYEPKTNTLTYTFDDTLPTQPKYALEVTVTDNVGNQTVLNASFYRK